MDSASAAAGRRAQAYLETIERLEPDIAMVDHDAAMASIAISLRRIADVFELARPAFQEYYASKEKRDAEARATIRSALPELVEIATMLNGLPHPGG